MKTTKILVLIAAAILAVCLPSCSSREDEPATQSLEGTKWSNTFWNPTLGDQKITFSFTSSKKGVYTQLFVTTNLIFTKNFSYSYIPPEIVITIHHSENDDDNEKISGIISDNKMYLGQNATVYVKE